MNLDAHIDIPLRDGGSMRGWLARPAVLPAPAIVLVHEWFGLNTQIIETARRLAEEGFVVLCADLYHGAVASDVEGARTLIQTIRDDEALATLAACAAWLHASPDCNGKVASMGYCLGGGWALNMAIAGSVDAAVVFYGNVVHTDAEIAQIHCPLLGHFGERDEVFTPPTVHVLAGQLQAADVADAELHWYPAGHAFANPYRPLYDAPSAALAWQRTLDFLRRTCAA
ncbi:MAG: dienelactone hydrolase family protein [Variovorax sp.]